MGVDLSLSVGFTGTREGMTPHQIHRFEGLIRSMYNMSEFHHGDCIGCDDQSHTMVRYFRPDVQIIIHPPEKDTYRAFKKGVSEERERCGYLHRNQNIVHDSDIMIACPKTHHEVNRSGTWSTIRYAVKNEVPVIVLYPDARIRL